MQKVVLSLQIFSSKIDFGRVGHIITKSEEIQENQNVTLYLKGNCKGPGPLPSYKMWMDIYSYCNNLNCCKIKI